MLDTKLNTFLTLAKVKNYTIAAEILNLTQPAVSQHIRFLEAYYNVPLFKKKGRNIELTDEGKILKKYGHEIDTIYRCLDTEIRNKAGMVKTYNIGASKTIGGYVLPPILAKHKNIYSNTTMLLHVYNTEEIIEKLQTRQLDFALVEGTFDKQKFRFHKLKDDELVLAVSPKHRFYTQKSVDIKEVINGNLIFREKGSGTREIFEDTITKIGYNLKDIENYMEIGSISAIKSLVESNLGYTIISKETIKKELEIGTITIVPISDIKIFREFNFVWLQENNEKFINEFIKFCTKYIFSSEYIYNTLKRGY